MAWFGFDVRPGERRLLGSLGATLATIIASHTMLETARDTLFLEKLPASRLAFVYVALAGVALVLGRFGNWFSKQLGGRAALAVTLGQSAFVVAFIALRPVSTALVYIFYVATGVIATLTTLQFWLVAADRFTVSQGKRLFGYLAAGGVVGAVAGASLAALVLRLGSIVHLTAAAAALFWIAAMIAAFALPADEPQVNAPPFRKSKNAPGPEEASPRYARLLMMLTALATASVLVVDYLFKSASASAFPPAELGTFFAVFYAITNVLALCVQLVFSGGIVRRLGVIAAILVFPTLVLAASGAAVVTGAFAAILVLKGVDGALRHSLHRVTSELLLLPLAVSARNSVKTLLDTVFSRGVQAAVALGLLALSMAEVTSGRALASIVLVFATAWFVAAILVRGPYRKVLGEALALGRLSRGEGILQLDIPAVESLIEAVSSEDEAAAIAALELLEESGRPRLIPALVLRHPSEVVILRALPIVATVDRRDWLAHIDHLLSHPSVAVRVASLRASAVAGRTGVIERGLVDPDFTVRCTAAFFSAWYEADPANYPAIDAIVDAPGDDGVRARKQLLDLVSQYGGSRHARLVRSCVQRDLKRKGSMLSIAPAVRATQDTSLLGELIRALPDRVARPVIRDALEGLGDAAGAALRQAYESVHTSTAVRSHIPRTLMRFPSQATVDFLSRALEHEKHGRTRFKVLRALGYLSSAKDDDKKPLHFERLLFEREALRNLVEHGRLLGIHAALTSDPEKANAAWQQETNEAVHAALLALLGDKAEQALERAFRCLGISHRGEDIYGVFLALTRGDKRARATATEFLDALSFDVGELREALRLVLDDVDVVARARRMADSFGFGYPEGHDAAVRLLLDDADELLAAMAVFHVFEAGIVRLAADARTVLEQRPALSRLGADPDVPPSEVRGQAL